jgi:RimJ/RimL family protein N-acetyltransferase
LSLGEASDRRYAAARELDPGHYGLVKPLYEDLSYNLVVDSVIAGNTPGRILVDDASAPHTAWLWNRMGTMLVAGNPDNDAFNRALSTVLSQEVLPDARRRRIPSLTLHYSPDAWEDSIDRLFPGLSSEKAWRRFYRFDHLKVDWKAELNQSNVMRPLDESLLRTDHLENVEHVLGWIHSFWHSIEDFLETGFGFCITRGEAVASWCLTVYARGRDFELGLATLPEYRNRGYATCTAAASVEHSVRSGFTPHWHCDEENVASMRVAERVGFSDPVRYTVYTFTL